MATQADPDHDFYLMQIRMQIMDPDFYLMRMWIRIQLFTLMRTLMQMLLFCADPDQAQVIISQKNFFISIIS